MKKIFFALCLVFALAGCKKDEPSRAILGFSAGEGVWYGDYYDIGYDNYYVTLSGDATLYLDLNVPVSTSRFLPQGKYAPRVGDNFDYTFNLGYEYPNGEVGYSCIKLGKAVYAVEDGELTFSYERTECSVGGWIQANGTEYEIRYTGNLEISEYEPEGGDLTSGALEHATAYYYGDFYEVGADDYWLDLYTGTYDSDGINFTTPGVEVYLDILTTAGSGTSIPAGTYNISDTEEDGAWHILTGFEDSGSIYPSYLYIQYDSAADDCYLDVITGGTLTVAKNGGNYSIKATIVSGGDTYEYTYDGPVSFKDERSTSSVTKSKLSRRFGRISKRRILR